MAPGADPPRARRGTVRRVQAQRAAPGPVEEVAVGRPTVRVARGRLAVAVVGLGRRPGAGLRAREHGGATEPAVGA